MHSTLLHVIRYQRTKGKKTKRGDNTTMSGKRTSSSNNESERIKFRATLDCLEISSEAPESNDFPVLSEIYPIPLVTFSELAAKLEHHFCTPLPPCDEMFPWLHGARYLGNIKVNPPQYTPIVPVRSCPVENALSCSGRLKGSVQPSELLLPANEDSAAILKTVLESIVFPGDYQSVYDMVERTGLLPVFRNFQPEVSFRRFDIQVLRMCEISDFFVYCFNEECECYMVAKLLYIAQQKYAVDNSTGACSTSIVAQQDYQQILDNNRHLFAMELMHEHDLAKGPDQLCSNFDVACFNDLDGNFFYREKLEISKMSTATKVLDHVWFGNTTDFDVAKIKRVVKPAKTTGPLYIDPTHTTVSVDTRYVDVGGVDGLLLTPPATEWKFFVHCVEAAAFPTDLSNQVIEFPRAGSVGLASLNSEHIVAWVNLCKMVYTNAHETLVFCQDGYTELSLFAISYLMFALDLPLVDVALKLHKEFGRPFYLFPTDVTVLSKMEQIFRHFSPLRGHTTMLVDLEDISLGGVLLRSPSASWLTTLKGSVPSRILPHLYLGSFEHANCTELLEELGITHVLSVGEEVHWVKNQNPVHMSDNVSIFKSGKMSLMNVKNLGDNGVDALSANLQGCLDFIQSAYAADTKILVHCMVGVSRSATVCIAEVMKRLNVPMVKAYLYVRVRRLNIIIQPNLRFVYELVKWEEQQRARRKFSTASASSAKIMSRTPSTDGTLSGMSFDSKPQPSVHVAELPVAGSGQVSPSPFPETSWLRDIDWHILCREISLLNNACIG